MSQLSINIANIVVQMESLDERVNIELDAAVSKFVVPTVTRPDARVTIRLDDLPREIEGELLFDSHAVWKLFRSADEFYYRFDMPLTAPQPYAIARFNVDYSQGEVLLNQDFFADRPNYPLAYPLDELLILNLLTRGRGIELHCCGLELENGDGIIFAGQSGRGKTTTAQLWQEHAPVKILSDDRIIVRRDADGFWMYGTPWHGDARLSEAQRAPLRELFFIMHGTQNRLHKLHPADTVARLFSCGFPLFYSAEHLEVTLEFYEQLARNVDCHLFEFVPDADAVSFIRQHTLN